MRLRNNVWLRCWCMAAVLLSASAACWAQKDPGVRKGPAGAGGPLNGLTDIEKKMFLEGQQRAIQLEGVCDDCSDLTLGSFTDPDQANLVTKTNSSGLGVRFINPFDIPEDLLRSFPEKQSLELGAIPVEQEQGRLLMAFREPPASGQVERLRRQFGLSVRPLLARPSSIVFARHRAYPRLVLGDSPVIAYSQRF